VISAMPERGDDARAILAAFRMHFDAPDLRSKTGRYD
jgi:hypothetical protein